MKMEPRKIKQLLQAYFNGESTEADEQKLRAYFGAGEVADEVVGYAGFFGGLSELNQSANDPAIEGEVMDYILENEYQDSKRYRQMWRMVTGIAASVIIVLGGFLFFMERQNTFEDTFKDPGEAYAYAEKTLHFVSGKYQEGMAQLSVFERIQKVGELMKNGSEPIADFYNEFGMFKKEQKDK